MSSNSSDLFLVATECKKAAFDCGFRRMLGMDDHWFMFGSTTAKGRIWLAGEGSGGPWHFALDHPGVAAEIDATSIMLAGPGIARYSFSTLGELYAVLKRAYELAVRLPFPENSLDAFKQATNGMPRTTEAERQTVQRIGQDIYRDSLMAYWKGQCPLTGIAEPELLRASHAKPWKDCETDGERLDVHNGLLLSALWDAAFDKGLVTFSERGEVVFSNSLSGVAKSVLLGDRDSKVKLEAEHQEYMAWHRDVVFQKA